MGEWRDGIYVARLLCRRIFFIALLAHTNTHTQKANCEGLPKIRRRDHTDGGIKNATSDEQMLTARWMRLNRDECRNHDDETLKREWEFGE